MLNRLRNRFAAVFSAEPFDSSVFNDKLANEISWEPLSNGGASFRTRILVEERPARFTYRSSTGGKLFSCLFVVVGFIVTVVGLSGFLLNDSMPYYVPLVVGGLFVVGGSWMLKWMSKRIVFDCGAEKFWTNFKEPRDVPMSKSQELIHFNKIHALQILREQISSSKRSYYSYEFNLVLTDGNRVQVIKHGQGDELLFEMAFLALAMDKPLWSAVDRTNPQCPNVSELKELALRADVTEKKTY